MIASRLCKFLIFIAIGFLCSCQLRQNTTDLKSEEISTYVKDIQPIFDKKCISCHACYQSPCQVNLTSFEGFERGASKFNTYAKRIGKIEPMRLFVDATKAEDWHSDRGFWPIVKPGKHQSSILWQMLDLKKEFPNLKIRENTEDALLSRHSCPEMDKGVSSFRDHYRKASFFDVTPLDLAKPDKKSFGMPYGLPALSSNEISTVTAWIDAGANGPNASDTIKMTMPKSKLIRAAIEEWEQFLNPPAKDLKGKLVSRYLYEHLFMAHLYFGDDEGNFLNVADGEFYQIVRAANRRGPVHGVSKSRHPFDAYDSSGSRFFYRIRKVQGTIVHKTHITYELSSKKMLRFRELFIDSKWTVAKLPAYGAAGSNPFTTYRSIPAIARYLFLLDDAEYFTRTDIRGPVCSGQLAVNVIQDAGWKLFVDPSQDLSVTMPDYFQQAHPDTGESMAELLALPAASQSSATAAIFSSTKFLSKQLRYRSLKDSLYAKKLPRYGTSRIWQGNSNKLISKDILGTLKHGRTQYSGSALTVFRNFDNAVVVGGLLGELPKTAELIDFPIMERTYYDLVAGFDVFASTEDGVNTRSYKNALRNESEYNFLQMFPMRYRSLVWEYWYSSNFGSIGDAALKKLMQKFNKLIPGPTDSSREATGIDRFSRIESKSGEFLSNLILTETANMFKQNSALPQDFINCPQCQYPAGQSKVPASILALLVKAKKSGAFPQWFPELSFIEITTNSGEIVPITLFANRFRTHVNTLIRESNTRVPEKDSLSFVHGYVGSYPNMFYTLSENSLSGFLKNMQSITSKAEWEHFSKLHQGVGRDSARIWDVSERIYENVLSRSPVEAGRYDLSRYEIFYRN